MTAYIKYRQNVPGSPHASTESLNRPLTNAEIDGNMASIVTELGTKIGAESPTLTGIPTAPTAAAATNTTQLATTAFVLTNSVLKTAAATAGTFDTSTTTPTGTIRLNYGGYFYPTLLNLVGAADTVTAATHYFVETGTDGYVRPKTLANVQTEVVTTAAVNSAAATTVGTVTTGTWSATAIAIAKGGTGATTAQTAINALAAATTSGQYLRGNGTNVVMSAIQAADVPTLNQDTTGTATTATNLSGGTASTSAVAANGYGLWGSTPITYGMLMTTGVDATYGGRMGAITSTAPEATTVATADSTSDYNTYFTMSGGTNRGFVFRNSFASKLFSINGDGVRSTVAMAAPSFNGITVASNNAATSLASSAASGTATSVSRSDHVHPFPTPNAIGTYNKTEIDQLVTGLDAKASVKAATTANITLSAPQSIDGVSLVAGDRVLVKNQTNTIQNGIYLVAAGAWTRTADADGSGELKVGTYVLVTSGTTQANTGWVINTPGAVLPGTDSITWTQFNGLGHIEAGTALSKSGNVISVGTSGTASASTYLRGDGAWSSLYIGTTSVQNTSAAQALTGITSVTSGTTLALNSTGANAISLDSTTTGAINIGTNANAKTITIGNTTGASGVVVNSGTAGVTFNQIATSVFKVAATAAPTTDMVQFTNAGFANVTAGVNAVNITYVGGAAAVESSAQRIDITPGTTSGGIWSALRVVPTTVPVTGVTLNGVKFENITTGAGAENMIYAGTGWDQILSYGGTSIISGAGLVNAAQLTGSVPSASLTTSINIGTTSIALNRASAEQALTGITGISTTSTTALTLDSGTTGAVNIGTNANAKTVTIGNTTGATSVVVNAGTGGVKLPTVGTSGFVKLGAGGLLSADTTTYLSGTVPIGNGGTNITTYAAGDILYASATNVLSKLAKGSDGQVLKLTSGFPAWATDTDTVYSLPAATSTVLGGIKLFNDTAQTTSCKCSINHCC